MLKCITFDGDVSTLNDLMEYLEKITQDLMEVNKLLCDKQAGQPIFLREGPRIVRLRQEDILYMEGYGGDYVKVHRTDGKPILSQVSLKRFEECLSGNNFCRVHRSYIVSLYHINYIERKRIRIDGALIPISDSYLPTLMNKLCMQT